MNLPEGWPTEEMLYAAQGVNLTTEHPNISYLREVIRVALAAAPTPPVPVLQLETQLSEKDVKALNDYLVQVRATPQAQKDEPVAYVNDESLMRLEVIAASRNVTRFFNFPLYTRPDDKLRKLANEYIEYMRPGADVDRSTGQIMSFLYYYGWNLRAALEGQTAPQAATQCFVASKFGPEVSE